MLSVDILVMVFTFLSTLFLDIMALIVTVVALAVPQTLSIHIAAALITVDHRVPVLVPALVLGAEELDVREKIFIIQKPLI